MPNPCGVVVALHRAQIEVDGPLGGTIADVLAGLPLGMRSITHQAAACREMLARTNAHHCRESMWQVFFFECVFQMSWRGFRISLIQKNNEIKLKFGSEIHCDFKCCLNHFSASIADTF